MRLGVRFCWGTELATLTPASGVIGLAGTHELPHELAGWVVREKVRLSD